MRTVVTVVLVWFALGGAFTLGCWWQSKHSERRIENAFREGWDSGRDWQQAHGNGGD